MEHFYFNGQPVVPSSSLWTATTRAASYTSLNLYPVVIAMVARDPGYYGVKLPHHSPRSRAQRRHNYYAVIRFLGGDPKRMITGAVP